GASGSPRPGLRVGEERVSEGRFGARCRSCSNQGTPEDPRTALAERSADLARRKGSAFLRRSGERQDRYRQLLLLQVRRDLPDGDGESGEGAEAAGRPGGPANLHVLNHSEA